MGELSNGGEESDFDSEWINGMPGLPATLCLSRNSSAVTTHRLDSPPPPTAHFPNPNKISEQLFPPKTTSRL